MLHYRALKLARRHPPPGARWVGALLVLLFCAGVLRAAVVGVHDEGAGNDYMSGEPITLRSEEHTSELQSPY